MRLELDVRDINLARRDGMLAKIGQACAEVAVRSGVKVRTETVNQDASAECDAGEW